MLGGVMYDQVILCQIRSD